MERAFVSFSVTNEISERRQGEEKERTDPGPERGPEELEHKSAEAEAQVEEIERSGTKIERKEKVVISGG